MINEFLLKLPLASMVFLAYAVVGAIMLLSGTQDYGSYSSNLMAIGIACGALGVPRAVSKLALGHQSTNLFGIVESLPIPSLVFVIFLVVSSVDLAMTHITFGVFSDNVMKIGIACGVIQVARSVEHVFGPSEALPEPTDLSNAPTPDILAASAPAGAGEPPEPPSSAGAAIPAASPPPSGTPPTA